MSSTGAAAVLTAPEIYSSLSPLPELTLGLRAPPTLLSTSSGGKSTITHISGPGTPARLGTVTHVTSFSHASPGGQGGRSMKVSPSSPLHHHQPLTETASGSRAGGFLYPLLSHGARGKLRPRERRRLPTGHSQLVAQLRPDTSLSPTRGLRKVLCLP